MKNNEKSNIASNSIANWIINGGGWLEGEGDFGGQGNGKWMGR
jgi:hypothetical protein